MIKTINHVGISVSNLDQSIRFYRDLLHMEVMIQKTFEGEKYDAILGFKGAKGILALLQAGGLRVELFEFSYPPPKRIALDRPVCDHGITHFCIEVTNIDQEYERLKGVGVVFHCAPIDFSGHAKATYARDPDGNVFELLQRRSSSEVSSCEI